MEKGYDAKNPVSIAQYAARLEGQKLREVLEKEDLLKATAESNSVNKGMFGECLEKHYFHIRPNNTDGSPDFKEAGVELKSSPLKEVKSGRISIKERLVLGMISYPDLPSEVFETSNLMKKSGKMLLVFYKFTKGEPVINMEVDLTGLWEFPDEDRLLIRRDWEKIQGIVMEGKAHELSEGDTMYLGACTKADNSSRLRCQYNSKIPAKPRAFSLKAAYVRTIYERLKAKKVFDRSDSIIKIPEELKAKTFEDLVKEKFKPYLGMSREELAREFSLNIKTNAKSYNNVLTRKILKVQKSISEFDKAGIILRSIVLEPSGSLKESVSFPAFDYSELRDEPSWDESEVRQQFESRFFFVIYKKKKNGTKVLTKVMFWSMPQKDLLKARDVWERTREMIQQGRYDSLPKISDNMVAHIRPHGRNKRDRVQTPDGKMEIRRCFWLNAKYIEAQIRKDPGQWADDYSA